MKKLIFLSLLTIGFLSCNNTTSKGKDGLKKEAVTAKKQLPLLQLGCYSFNGNNNTIILEITNLRNGVNGDLTYIFEGKDNRSGTLIGKVTGDKLFGEYTFMSEGVESIREVAFLIKDGQLIEGYGELNENGTAFVAKSNLEFTSTMPLTKTECDD
ncbi:hypothetical protein MWU65_17015 [Cellulophaga sp. F20128]|uniref:hypothetical protein n=1 Tax=Cellulophaga sp. F20128 TaxID=2926413 RepID=UPI001FF16046|nr:hypothetical protein [Cellulophaga sp. F20128]MCK0158891.1 hypothetical protein [Cellulophaga sp. F20128]